MERESSKEWSVFFLWRKGLSFYSREFNLVFFTVERIFKTDQSMRRCFGWIIQPRKRRFCWIFRYILNSMVKKITLLKGNLCNYKSFIDALISTFFVRWLQNAPRFWDWFCAEFCHVLCRFYLRWWMHDRDNLTLIALKDYLFGFWKKDFQVTASPAIVLSLFIIHKISLKHDSDTSASKLSLHASVNSWHYSCPRSVYCRSIVFLLVV